MKIEMDISASDNMPGVLFWDKSNNRQWIRINNDGFIYIRRYLPEIIFTTNLFDIIGVDLI